jgi:hypothetical protein
MANSILSHMSKWFTANLLAPSLGTTKIIKFVINNSQQCALNTFWGISSNSKRIFTLQKKISLGYCQTMKLMQKPI